ncbi:uncharacterized protein [Dermacentor albipictus]|uniref:uncharacterized protein n=1 Tax=Dermacentor albipictus TaxID=60249 RepID=UPI0038FC2702
MTCVDYQAMERANLPDRYPVLHIHDVTANRHGAMILSKIDLVRAYHQSPMAPKDNPKMATKTPSFGLFEVFCMSFDLRKSGQTYKSEFGVDKLTFLGYVVSNSGIQQYADKVIAVEKFPGPNAKYDLREYLGLGKYYRRFVLQCAAILQPLHLLMTTHESATSELRWTENAHVSFEAINRCLADATLIAYPKPGVQ